MRENRQRGQILLISLLVLSIATTVVLSIIGKSTTDVTITSQIGESSRAFSAAEAGIEETLKTGIGTASPRELAAGVKYTVVKEDIGGATGVYKFPNKITRGTSETLWLTSHDANGKLVETPTYTAASIDVCWSQEATIPAMIVSVFYKTLGGQYRVAKGAYDPNGTRAATNKFSGVTAASGGCGAGTSTTYKQTITFGGFTPAINPASDTLLMLRIQPVYADALLAINASGTLPSQGNRLESSGSTDSGVTRKVVVYQQYRSPPSIFDYAVYSQGSFGH